MLGMWSQEYYHWFHDTLPRLWGCLKHLPHGVHFLVHSAPRTYQLESLAMLGIKAEQIILQPPIIDTCVDNLWFSTPAGYTTFGSGGGISAMAAQVRSRVEEACTPRIASNKRLYISRSRASCRRVINEDDLMPILTKHEFRLVDLEDYPFHHQVELCGNAGILVGPHGAGLTNLMFMKRPGRIGEIAGYGVVPCYSYLSRQLGHEFSRFFAEQDCRDASYRVDPYMFDAWLENLCATW
jgi:capsular polysaccharide biosynthesis protein